MVLATARDMTEMLTERLEVEQVGSRWEVQLHPEMDHLRPAVVVPPRSLRISTELMLWGPDWAGT